MHAAILGGVATLRITRDRSWYGRLVTYRIDLGVRRVGRVRAGHSIDLVVDPGQHRLTVWSGKIRIGSETLTVADGLSECMLTPAAQPVWKSYLGLGGQPITIHRRSSA